MIKGEGFGSKGVWVIGAGKGKAFGSWSFKAVHQITSGP